MRKHTLSKVVRIKHNITTAALKRGPRYIGHTLRFGQEFQYTSLPRKMTDLQLFDKITAVTVTSLRWFRCHVSFTFSPVNVRYYYKCTAALYTAFSIRCPRTLTPRHETRWAIWNNWTPSKGAQPVRREVHGTAYS